MNQKPQMKDIIKQNQSHRITKKKSKNNLSKKLNRLFKTEKKPVNKI